MQIFKIQTNLLSYADRRDIKQLWHVVQSSSNMKNETRSCDLSNSPASGKTAALLNVYLAELQLMTITLLKLLNLPYKKLRKDHIQFYIIPLAAFGFDIILNEVKSTSPGPDCIPHWILRVCASHLSQVYSKIANHSSCNSWVSTAWHQAAVTPVPKTLPVTGPSDF